jgi:pantoate kinase
MYVTLIEDLRAVRRIPRSTAWRLEVHLELPISQGFGMSAAGFLAAGVAVLEANGAPDADYAARAAHRLERLHRGGLGDVLALQAGGMALRRQPGAPGVSGIAEGAAIDVPVLLVWQPDETRHTSAYIDHPGWKRSITEAGEVALAPLLDGPWDESRWDDLLLAAADFASVSGLEDEVERAWLLQAVQVALIETGLNEAWTCRLCMLGVSAVVVPRRPVGAMPGALEVLRMPLEQAGFEVSMCGLSTPVSGEEE